MQKVKSLYKKVKSCPVFFTKYPVRENYQIL